MQIASVCTGPVLCSSSSANTTQHLNTRYLNCYQRNSLCNVTLPAIIVYGAPLEGEYAIANVSRCVMCPIGNMGKISHLTSCRRRRRRRDHLIIVFSDALTKHLMFTLLSLGITLLVFSVISG